MGATGAVSDLDLDAGRREGLMEAMLRYGGPNTTHDVASVYLLARVADYPSGLLLALADLLVDSTMGEPDPEFRATLKRRAVEAFDRAQSLRAKKKGKP
jgi:hypothetical protein